MSACVAHSCRFVKWDSKDKQTLGQKSQEAQLVSGSHAVSRNGKSKKGHLKKHLSEADINEHIKEEFVDLKTSTRTELPAEQQLVESSEDDEPPEHFSLMDTKKQVLIEEQKKQHLAKRVSVTTLHYIYTKISKSNKRRALHVAL
ncbi:uncharacterized protein [Dysidea avara]|uniref:uncharacterized protein n=1 Tax=Dysidea avara TaxID=196820 RepID=UPI0033228442